MGLKDQLNKRRRINLGLGEGKNDITQYEELRIEDVEKDPDQPRKHLGDISELKASIEQHGVLQPIIVSPISEQRYRLIAGERRYTAVKELDKRTIPALIRSVEDHERMQLQIIENLHRKNLDPFEEAFGYAHLKTQFSLTQEAIAKQVGKSRTHVTQMLSLANIPESVREKIESLNVDGVKKSLSYDTLFQIAKQGSPEKMEVLLESIKNGVTREEQRTIARKTKPRGTNAPQKPKTTYSTKHDAVVVVQSLSSASLDKGRVMRALKEALEKVEQAGN